MRCAIIILVACVLQLGCSQNPYLDANIELMNAERRGLEDRLYDLEYEYEANVEELERLRRENQQLRDRSATSPSPANDRRPSPPSNDVPPQTNDDDLIPRIELPPLLEDASNERVPGPAAPVPVASLPGPRLSQPRLSQPRLSQPRLSKRPIDEAAADQIVTHVQLQRGSLSGVDFDEQEGDDGLSLIIEPRNASDDIVPLARPITIVVLDYAYRGSDDARVAQWELTAEDTERFLQDSPAKQGIQMHLLWPEQPPDHERLLVHVRYHTEDGRKLETKNDVRVSLPTRISQRWTPRVEPASRAASPPSQESSESVTTPEWKPWR